MEGPSNNPLALSNLYPGSGTTTAQAGSAQSPGTTRDTSDTLPLISKLEEGFMFAALGQPVKWWIALIVVTFGGMWLLTRYSGSPASANIRFNFYNVVAIFLLSILGGAIAKALAAKYQKYLPGISTVILAS